MKKKILTYARAAVFAAFAFFAAGLVSAQTVTQQPSFVAPRAILDMGNGPLEVQALLGSGGFFTSQGSGLGSTSGSSTTLTLTATAAANPPCVGCIISGTGITSGTTVAAFNGTTTITLSAATDRRRFDAACMGRSVPRADQTKLPWRRRKPR